MKDLLRDPPAIGPRLSFVNAVDEKEGSGKKYIPNTEKFKY